MKAAIYPGHGKPITIEDIPDPQPGPDDVIIKVARCGICGTDTSFTRGAMFDFGENTQFGHEYAGEIVETRQGRQPTSRWATASPCCLRSPAANARRAGRTATTCCA